MSTKEFKSIDEQIGILQSRGLSIDDVNYARNFLYRKNYYTLLVWIASKNMLTIRWGQLEIQGE